MADIASGNSPQNGVGNGMQGHIGIGMSFQSSVVGNQHPPQPDTISDRRESMHIHSHTDTKAGGGGEMPTGPLQVDIGGDLDVILIAVDQGHRQARCLGNRRIIGEFPPRMGAMCGHNIGIAKPLRRLGSPQTGPINRAGSNPSDLGPFQCIDYGQGGDGTGIVFQRGQNATDSAAIDKRAGPIMNKDKIRSQDTEALQTQKNGFLPGPAAIDRIQQRQPLRRLIVQSPIIRMDDGSDSGKGWIGSQRGQGVTQNRPAGQISVLFGKAFPHAVPSPRSHHQRHCLRHQHASFNGSWQIYAAITGLPSGTAPSPYRKQCYSRHHVRTTRP